MEIAYIPVPVAAAFVPKIHFVNCDTTCISYYSKNQCDTFVWQIMFVTTKLHYSEGSKSLLMN